MAHSSHEQHHVSPLGTLIHEPTFPDISGNPIDPTDGVQLKLAATDGGSPASMSRQALVSDSEDSKNAPNPMTEQSNLADTRPAQQRWATERPKPSAKYSLLGANMQSNDASRANKPATVTFDNHSESDSDSSDDERMPRKSLSHDANIVRQETHSRRKSTANPFSRLKLANDHFNTQGKVSKSDGRLKLSLQESDGNSGYLAKALGAVLSKHTKNEEEMSATGYDKRQTKAMKIAPEDDEMEHDPSRRMRLNIVIIIIGSRGDIQPFIRIAKILKNDYGHRVRMATHSAFKDFVEKDSGLEFFSIGGNPAELMAFMVKNPGLIPGLDTIKEGEIGRRRAQMYEMFQGMWRACINATDDETDQTNAKMSKF